MGRASVRGVFIESKLPTRPAQCAMKKISPYFPIKDCNNHYDFRVYCTHKSNGCKWTGELRELDNHLNSDPPADKSLQGCPYTLINCPLNCAECVKGVYRKDMKAHINDRLFNKVVMQNAQIESLKQQLQGISTQFEIELEKIKEGKESLEQRMTELETTVSELRVENRKLDMQNKKLEKELKLKQAVVGPPDLSISKQSPATSATYMYKPQGSEFIMTDFNEYQMDGEEWFSPHFYTHSNGYKMCLRVNPSGSGPGKGTHLSVYVFLMRGEFDDQLKWPFGGEITVKLVDQEEHKDHVVKKICFAHTSSASDKSCNRVITEERASNGTGYGQFLSLAELRPKYLKNNSIKLCIKRARVEIY